MIDDLAEKSIFVNRFWVYCFVRRHSEKRAVQGAKYLEGELFWNADETGVGPAKYISSPDVIIASGIKQGLATIPEIRDGAQLTLLTIISAFVDSTDPYFISKNKAFEKTVLEAQQLFEGLDN